MAMFWPRMLIALWILSPALGWCAETDVQKVQTLIQKLKDPDPTVRGLSVRELAKIGPEARAAIPALIEALVDDEQFDERYERICAEASQALFEVGLEAIPALTAAVAADEFAGRQHALDCLAKFGPRARTSLDAIAKVLSGPVLMDYDNAQEALCQIDAHGSIAVPILERFLKSKRNTTEGDIDGGEVLRKLWRYPDHPRTLPLLLAAVKNPDPEVRGGAVLALTRTPGHSDQIVAALLPLLHDRKMKTILETSICIVNKQRIMDYVLTALAAHGAPGEKVVPELIKELEVPVAGPFDEPRIKVVLWSISEFSPTPPGTAGRVLKSYEQAVERRRAAVKFQKVPEDFIDTELIAISCLARMPQQAAEFTPKWKAWLKSPDEHQRFEAAIVLASIDPDHHPDAVDQVLKVIDEQSGQFTEQDAYVLHLDRAHRFSTSTADCIPEIAVRSLLANPRLLERILPKIAEWTVKGIVPWDDAALRRNMKRLQPKAAVFAQALLDKSYSEDCQAAVRALGPDIVPILIANARQRLAAYQADPKADHWTTAPVLELLPNWSTPAVTAWKVLLDYSNSTNPHYRAVAYEVLGKIRVLHGKALPELLKGLGDSRCIVRVAAANGLGLISDRNRVVCPALIGMLADDFADVRVAALESLVKLGVDEPGVRDAIQKVSQDPHPYVRLLASEALGPNKP
ncbi:MAG: putative lyase [Planctomycetaceae bacterium]|nr:putative lyase [Planctomycetaceae bacterium]